MSRQSPSVQLYSVREALSRDALGTLQRLADIGFTNVEPFGLVDFADVLADALPATGLAAPSSHASVLAAASEPDDSTTGVDAVFTAARRLGVHTIIDPYVPEERWMNRADIESTAHQLNAIAERAADHGLRIGYHNHWWELEQRIDGTPALEVFAGALSSHVVLEVDTYWSAVGGVDPVALLGRLGERVVAVHIKDGPISRDPHSQLPAGQGAVPVADVLAAAPNALPVIEFDEYAGDIFAGIAASLAFVTARVAA